LREALSSKTPGLRREYFRAVIMLLQIQAKYFHAALRAKNMEKRQPASNGLPPSALARPIVRRYEEKTAPETAATSGFPVPLQAAGFPLVCIAPLLSGIFRKTTPVSGMIRSQKPGAGGLARCFR